MTEHDGDALIGATAEATTAAMTAATTEAMTAARQAAVQWGNVSGEQRSVVLEAAADALRDQAVRLEKKMATASGRPIMVAREKDLPAIEWAVRHQASRARLGAERKDVKRCGVCLVLDGTCVAPEISVLHVASALAAGNAVVWAAVPDRATWASELADLCQSAGLPSGVLSVLNVDVDGLASVTRVCDADEVVCLAGNATARDAAAWAASEGALLRLHSEALEVVVVLSDADVDSAVEAIADTIVSRAGSALTPLRLLVHEAHAEYLVSRVGQRLSRLRAGDPLDPAVDLVTGWASPVSRTDIAAAIGEGSKLVVAEPAKDGPTVSEPDESVETAMLMDVAPATESHLSAAGSGLIVATTFRTRAEALALLYSLDAPLRLSLWGEEIGPTFSIARQAPASSVFVNASAHQLAIGKTPLSLIPELHPDPFWSNVSRHETSGSDASRSATDGDLEGLWQSWRDRMLAFAGPSRDLGDDGLVVTLPRPRGSVLLVADRGATVDELHSLTVGALASGNRVTLVAGASCQLDLESFERALSVAGVPTDTLTAHVWDDDADWPRLLETLTADAIWLVSPGGASPQLAAYAADRLLPVWHVAPLSAGGPGARTREILRQSLRWQVLVL